MGDVWVRVVEYYHCMLRMSVGNSLFDGIHTLDRRQGFKLIFSKTRNESIGQRN